MLPPVLFSPLFPLNFHDGKRPVAQTGSGQTQKKNHDKKSTKEKKAVFAQDMRAFRQKAGSDASLVHWAEESVWARDTVKKRHFCAVFI